MGLRLRFGVNVNVREGRAASDGFVPGVRMIEVVPPGSEVGIVLLPPGSPIPVAVRLGTGDADEAFARVGAAGVEVDNAEVLRWEGVPPMFAFHDPEGNHLVYLEDRRGS